MSNTCSMKFCQSNGRDKVRSFHRFPQDEERCKAWVEACGRPELLVRGVDYLHRQGHVCDLHFKPSDRIRKRLKENATPFPYDTSPTETKCTQTEIALPHETDSNIDNVPGTFTTANFTNKIRQAAQKKKLQLFALKLYLSCPTTYKVVRCAFCLPSEKVLRRTNLEIDTVISYPVYLYLKSKISSFKETNKYCTVCLKKMPLKRFLFYHINRDKIIGFRNIDGHEILEPATEAYVLMARGLNEKWEQPLAYCFLEKDDHVSNIYPWLESVLNAIIGIGYNVVALVVDHEDLYELFRGRIHSLAQPYIFLNDNQHQKQIYCIFDLPQLIISLRNTLMTHQLLFQDDENDGLTLIADWGTIEELVSADSKDGSQIFVPKLTKSHIHPNKSEKKELKYAVEVFSNSVSEALEAKSKKCVVYDRKIRGTQKLAALVNDVFDILNSSAHNHHNMCKNAFTGEPYQMKAIRRFMEFLTNVRPLNDTADPSFNCVIYGLRISIMSFSIILRDLLPKGIKSLVTHRFNLDAVENFFNLVRLKSRSEKPTAIQFFTHFRRTFMTELMRCPRTISNTDNLLHFVQKINLKQCELTYLKLYGFKKTIEVGTVDYRFELPKTNPFLYMCWYLLKKCYESHDNLQCEVLTRMLQEQVKGVAWRQYAWDSYFEPPGVLVDYVKVLDEEFNTCFGHKMDIGLGTGILSVLKELKFERICRCFPTNLLRRLFVRMRIFQIIRYNNRQLRDESFQFSPTNFHNIVDLL